LSCKLSVGDGPVEIQANFEEIGEHRHPRRSSQRWLPIAHLANPVFTENPRTAMRPTDDDLARSGPVIYSISMKDDDAFGGSLGEN